MDTSCGGEQTVLLMACSGGSNVGQLSNEVARQLTVEGKGSMSCLAGVGGHVEYGPAVRPLVASDQFSCSDRFWK